MKIVRDKRSDGFSRRRFLANTSALGAASFLGLPLAAQAEPPPETKKIRLVHVPAICPAPQYLAEELLQLEGFSEVEYVEITNNTGYSTLADGRVDMAQSAAPDLVAGLDASSGMISLAGVHAGCYELFVHPKISTIRDLKGKRAVVTGVPSTEYHFLYSIVAYVGIDPRKVGSDEFDKPSDRWSGRAFKGDNDGQPNAPEWRDW
jgi:NitT/TauT family transport system substrate-binding protein